jgi:pimeloyl-ACP methyl ester carboxylesterase
MPSSCQVAIASSPLPESNTRAKRGTPWWERLPDDFALHAEPGVLGLWQWPWVQGCATLELMMRVPLSAAVSSAMASSLLEPGKVAREFEALRFYEPYARTGDPSLVFLPPRDGVEIRRSAAPASAMLHADIRRFDLQFDSPFEPLNPAAASGFAKFKRNKIAHAEHWCHGDSPRPTVVVIHGFGSDRAWINARILGLQGLYRQGYDVLLFTYPHHGPRAEPASPFSGHGVFGNGLLQFNEVALHAIHDLRVFIRDLRENGVEHLGVAGISLGGYTAALLASIDDGLDFCIPVVPAVSSIDAFLEWQPSGALLSGLMRSQGVSVSEMRGLVAIHNPLTYAPRIDGDRMLIIAGAGDRIASPRQVNLLHEHWPGSELHWFAGSHLLHFGRGMYHDRMRALIDRATGRRA